MFVMKWCVIRYRQTERELKLSQIRLSEGGEGENKGERRSYIIFGRVGGKDELTHSIHEFIARSLKQRPDEPRSREGRRKVCGPPNLWSPPLKHILSSIRERDWSTGDEVLLRVFGVAPPPWCSTPRATPNFCVWPIRLIFTQSARLTVPWLDLLVRGPKHNWKSAQNLDRA